jgi:enediyne biosynthesis protein E4
MKFVKRALFLTLTSAAFVSTGLAQVTFKDITRQAGITFVHNNGAVGKKWLPETMGTGCAFIDYDNDGYPDILLVNGKDWTSPGKPSTMKLYHNNRN